jgi:hypothetical protein
MKLRILQLGLLFLLTAIPGFSQSAEDLEAKYGQPFKAYLIRPTVMMTVKYAENGQASEMLIAKRIDDGSNSTIAPVIVREIVEELVPVNSRGVKVDSPKQLPLGLGRSPVLVEEYENVSITYQRIDIKEAPACSGTAAILIRWKNRTGTTAKQ